MNDAAELWHERAAIREYDGGLPRDEAEALALGDVALQYGWPAVVGLVLERQDGQS
jgi:hypothetical protein